MDKKTFMYIVGIDEKQLDNIMLLSGEQEPENGDWTDLTRSWYADAVDLANLFQAKYCWAMDELERRESCEHL